MDRIIECVPNFSEGRRPEVIEAIAAVFRAQAQVSLLDVQSDQDHNRMVITVIGDPAAVCDACVAAATVATRLIDMNTQHGSHPRVGATDVIPLVPVRGVTMAECVALAHALGKRIAESLDIPVYFYEEAALRPERRNLAKVREGQYERLREEIVTPERGPDVGPASMHPTAGATVIGARAPLVAFNVNLNSDDLPMAKKIAKALRARDGGLAFVKAIGVRLAERNVVQVSMNLTDFTRTPIYRALELVRLEARRYQVDVLGTELVGLLPMDALAQSVQYYAQVAGRAEIDGVPVDQLDTLPLAALTRAAQAYMALESFRVEQILEANLR